MHLKLVLAFVFSLVVLVNGFNKDSLSEIENMSLIKLIRKICKIFDIRFVADLKIECARSSLNGVEDACRLLALFVETFIALVLIIISLGICLLISITVSFCYCFDNLQKSKKIKLLERNIMIKSMKS